MSAKSCFIRFMGDVMIGRLVNSAITNKGYRYPWGNVLPYLKRPGVNIINLEAALTSSKQKTEKLFNFKASPDKIATLIEANIQIANIANNHILDYSIDGMRETIATLNNAGILHTGAGDNMEEARTPVILDYNGIKIGVLGFTDNEPDWCANKHPGINHRKIGDVIGLEEDIIKLRKEVDILILSAHLGPNMIERPSPEKINFAHQLIDLGVDIIHGHSAHIFQGIENYEGKIIMYDTGDFIDDYEVDIQLKNNRSFLFEVEINDKKISRIKLLPVIIKNRQVNFAKGEDANWCIARMQNLSKSFNTTISDDGKILFN